jgi:hypothetical protein
MVECHDICQRSIPLSFAAASTSSTRHSKQLRPEFWRHADFRIKSGFDADFGIKISLRGFLYQNVNFEIALSHWS